ncbi:Dienelactone hydrolase [Sandaracinus amylolyticus]|uniref:Dienelactone hydrolase n=2 Tax=Sandaracinus amylolyticus TaxID=927083 RepID=A0A0F6YPA5_9BACT|nr:Dienelactone hydrolase [Sandaracinus amylolyticus]
MRVMSHVVVFHSALGLRPAITRFADRLRAAGHTVTTPDLYDGEVFDTLEEGVAKRDALGIGELIRRALVAVEDVPSDALYVGFSMGTGAAQLLAATRPGARGAVLLHGALPIEALELDAWPASVPLQIHVTTGDPWVDPSAVDDLAARVPSIEVHRYIGEQHLFTDEGSPEHLPDAARAAERETLRFLAQR